jgi:MFS family permease
VVTGAVGIETRSRRGLVGVLAAQAAAWTGTRFAAIALPWFVLTTTGSAVQTGAVVFAQMGPYVVVQALAGPLIDRIGPRRVSITGDLVAAGAMAMVPLLYFAGMLPLWALLGLIAVVGAADGPANAAKGVFIPQVTRAARVPLERGTGLSGALERSASTVGPAIAGFVVAAVGGAYALWITAAFLGIGSVIIAAAIPGGDTTKPQGDIAGGYVAQLRQGAEWLRDDRLLRSLVGMVAVTNLLDAALLSVALPVWAHSYGYGPVAIGLVISVMSGFAIATSVLAAMIGHRLPRRVVYLLCFLIGGAPRFVVLALGAPLWLVLGVHAIAGLGAGFVNPILGAVQFERIPEAMLGRVRTLIHALSWSGIPFGGLVGGTLIGLAGLGPALLLLAAGYLVATVLPGLQREWAQMNRPLPLPAAEDASPDRADP